MNHKNIVIYHNQCSDGFTSAAITKRYFKDSADYIPGIYGETPPDVTGKNVYFVDFSYKSEVIKEMLEKATHIYLIDHHITAINDLQQFTGHPKFTAYTDLKRSGAMLAWDYFYPNQQCPDLINYVQDRDLWNWSLPYTNEYLMALELSEFTFENYCNHLNKSLEQKNQEHTNELINQGTTVVKYYSQVVENICKNVYFIDYLDYKNIPIVNCTGRFSSHVGNTLAKLHPEIFSVMYEMQGNSVQLSFRSLDSGVDVSEIAKNLGGGGHKRASGAKITIEKFLQLFKGATN